MKDKRYIQLEKAHKYLEYLSSGFDPVTGYECKKEDVINKPMVSNCLKFVRDILLEEIIRYGSSDKKERQHIPFYELNSYISSFQYSKSPLSLEHIIYNINTLIDEDKYNILKLEDLINFLLAENLLIKHVDDQRLKYSYSVTKKGNNCGLLYNNGIIDCNEIAQKFIINNIEIWLPNSNYGQNKKSTNYAIIDNYLNDLNDNKEINIEQDIQIISKAQNKNTLNKDSCENCKSYRRGDCGGNSKICNDYEMAYTFSNKEVENWPKWGDATYFKHKKKPKG